ncbi:hypothetical protein ACQ4PT_063298 [Festuca glaucescens]
MEAALVTVSTGVIKPLLSKLFKLLGEEHAKLKGVRRDAKFIGDEMRSMQAALETLADEELLDPELRIWRDAVRELSYGTEDCVDDFVARVDHDHDGCTTFKKLVDMLKKPKYHHRTANEIGKLKTCATEASERHKRILELPPAVTCFHRLTSLYVHSHTRFPDGMIGKMQSLEELEMFGVHSYEQGKSLQELSQLTKLRRLQVLLGTFELWGGTGQIGDLHSYIGKLISSCSLRHLHIHKRSSDVLAVKTYFPLSLESWCPTTPCSLHELHITYCYIDKIPNWMRFL